MTLAVPHPELVGIRPGRVCIIKPSALGDVANAFAALDALRRHWPHCEITWVVNTGLRGLVDEHPSIDRVVAYDRRGIHVGPSGLTRLRGFLRELRAVRYDLAIDLQGLLRSGLMTRASRAPVRVGLADAREGAGWFYTHRVVPPGSIDDAHAVDRLLAVAGAFGADVTSPRFSVAAADRDRAWARRTLARIGRPRLALNLGARWETKRWPPRQFAEVARRAVRMFGAGLVALGAPEDQPFVAELIERLSPIPVVDLSGRTTLPQIAALFGEVDVVLSNDTGPLHLAVAAGARVVGVYTCTDPALNGPYGPLARAVETRVDCRASYRVTCPTLHCMTELAPDRVWPRVAEQLDAARRALSGPAA